MKSAKKRLGRHRAWRAVAEKMAARVSTGDKDERELYHQASQFAARKAEDALRSAAEHLAYDVLHDIEDGAD